MVGRAGLYGGCSNGVPPIHFFQAEQNSVQISTHAVLAFCRSGKDVEGCRCWPAVEVGKMWKAGGVSLL
jgi:hypothetical protein